MSERMYLVVMAVVVCGALFLCVMDTQADTWPRLNATAADTSYAAPADTPRLFDFNTLPAGERTITADGAYELGVVRKVEVLADGDAEVSYRKDDDGDWWIVVTMGTASNVYVSYWSDWSLN